MKDIKIRLKSGDAAQIRIAIKEQYGKDEIFEKYIHIKKGELRRYLKMEIPVKILCRIIERLELPDFKIIYDTKVSLKKKLTEIGMTMNEYEGKLNYEDNSIQRAFYRNKFSADMIEQITENLKKKHIDWRPWNQKLPINLKYIEVPPEGNSFATKNSINQFFEILIEYLKEQEIDNVKFLADNIEIFFCIDIFDWEFLRLIQELDQSEMEDLRKFLKEIALPCEDKWKYNECMKLQSAEDKDSEIHTFEEYISGIKESFEQLSVSDGFKYLELDFLMKMLPYIFYLDSNDWEMLAYFSLLANWKKREELYTRKKWGINFVRGMIYKHKNI